MSQTALIVDDSRLARITLQRLLENQNFRVIAAGSAREAFELLAQQPLPDIIFMDHLMPEMDGFEAMQRIKADPGLKHIPVVMCTGKEGNDDYDAQAKARGATATLSKPPELEQLHAVLHEVQAAAPAASSQEVQPEPLEAEPVLLEPEFAPQEEEAPLLEPEFMPQEAEPVLLQDLETSLEDDIPLITDTVLAEDLSPVEDDTAIPTLDEQPILTIQPVPAASMPAPEIDLSALEERLRADLQQIIAGLQQELSANQERGDSEVRSQLESQAQQLAALQASQLDAEQVRALIQENLPEQPESVTPEALEELQTQLQTQLKTLRQQLLSEIDSLRGELQQQPATPESLEELLASRQQSVMQEVESIRERATLAREALEQRFSELERAVADQHLLLSDQQTALNEQRNTLEALAAQPAAAVPAAGASDEAVQALEQRLAEFSQRLAQLQQDFEADLEQRAIPTLGSDPENLRAQVETDLVALKEQFTQELNALRTLVEQQSGSSASPDLAQLEARLAETAATAAEQRAQNLAASEIEQLGATLQGEIAALKTALQKLESADPLHPEFAPQVDSAQIEQLVQERLAIELDQARDQLMQRVADSIQQQVVDAQQELLDRQDMFEQERAALKRQIRSLKQNLVLMAAGSGLISLAALGAVLLL